MIYQPGDMRDASDPAAKPPAPVARAGPPQCARGCGWINDYAEPGFVCRKCQLWEGEAKTEPAPESTQTIRGLSSKDAGGSFGGVTPYCFSCHTVYAAGTVHNCPLQPYAPGAQAQCTGCGVVHALGSPCRCCSRCGSQVTAAGAAANAHKRWCFPCGGFYT